MNNDSTPRPRAIVYIDGYNWYHAIFKHRPEWKWLNIQSFFEMLRPRESVVSVKFFTAIVDEEDPNSEARERQSRYLAALGTLPKVKTIFGKFQNREVTCRAECGRKYQVPEEKKTDVNIAVEIMSDAFQNACDSIILVSGDSDAQPPLFWVKQNLSRKHISVYVPALPEEKSNRRLHFYQQNGINCDFLPLDGIKGHLFKNAVRLAGDEARFVVKPSSWARPEPAR